MQNEIAILDHLVDEALGAGIMKEKTRAAATINAIGVIKSQVPLIMQENEKLKKQLGDLQESKKPGPTKTKPVQPPKHKQN